MDVGTLGDGALSKGTIVGIDVGGTFTDFVIWRNGRREVYKVLSTHPTPEIGVAEGLRCLGVIGENSNGENAQNGSSHGENSQKESSKVKNSHGETLHGKNLQGEAGACVSPIGTSGSDLMGETGNAASRDISLDDLPDIIHGSTIATNALLERKGARVALLTTKGFTDLIDIGRQNRPHLYRFWSEKQLPLVPTDLRFAVEERTGADGKIVTGLDMSGFAAIVEELRKRKVDAVAICFLFSFLNPEHEAKVEKTLVDEGFFVSTSHKILPQFREYERLTTTVINAFVTPLVARYIDRLENVLGQASGRLKIMQSNGGLLSASATASQAVQTVLSGPAGGVVAALDCASKAGFRKVISFDMGGTSTDVSLLDNAIGITTEFDLDGLPVKIPMVDVHTVGAGGGSIAYVDEGGALQVGPESAGSNPGPVCYGRGNKPTITDANLMLGRMHPDKFLDGRQRLDKARTEIAFDGLFGELSGHLNMDRTALADGIMRIAISNMHKAIRKISVERGHDPRDFALVAYGGAGPMHACELAEASLISTVIIPPVPGVFSALGMTLADVVKDYSHTVFASNIKEFTIDELGKLFAPLEMQALRDLGDEGFKRNAISLKRMLDLRYAGQSFELTIEIDDSMNCPDDYIEQFHRTHKDRYGFESNEERIEAIAFRIRATGLRDKPDEANKQGSSPDANSDTALDTSLAADMAANLDAGLVANPATNVMVNLDENNGEPTRLTGLEVPATPTIPITPTAPTATAISANQGYQPAPKFVTKAYFAKWMQTSCFDRSDLVEGSTVTGPAIVFQLDTTTVIPPGWTGSVDRSGNIILRRTGNEDR